MGLFSRKPTLSSEEIQAKLNEIDVYINDEDYDSAFDCALKLEKEAKGYGAYHLGVCYHLGWGTEQDVAHAMKCYETATAVENGYEEMAWYMGGLLLSNALEEYEEAEKWLAKAEALGESDASLHLACAWFNISMKYRNMACRTLKMNEMTQANYVSVCYAIKAQSKYIEVAERAPETITFDHWCCLGRCVQLLYNLACRGELSMDVVSDNSIQSYLRNSMKMIGGGADEELKNSMLENAAAVCSIMDSCGRELIGEYFRAACGLLDTELNRSDDAFYRVRWHMKRIGELRNTAEDAAEIASFMTDVDDSYEKMNKKYGDAVLNMIRSGMMPDLTPSYLPGEAPSPESCDNFMQLVNQVRSAPVAQKKEKKGFFGFFKK